MKLLISSLTLFAIGLFITCIAIGMNLLSSLRLDEAQSVWVVTKTIPGILEFIAKDVHVPLYFILLHLWTQFFGTSVLAIRSLSVLFFLASIPSVYLLARESSTKRVARITTSLFCLSPFLTWYGTEARMYTMLVFFSSLSSLAFLRLLRSQAQSSKFFYIAVTALGLYTHYFFSIFVLIQALYFVARTWLNRQSTGVFWRPVLRFTALLLILALIMAPWLAYVYLQGSAADTRPLLSLPSSYTLLLLFVQFFTGFQTATIENGLISIWPIILVVLFLTFNKKRKFTVRDTAYFIVVTAGSVLLAMVVSFTVQPILVARYLIFIAPTLFYLIALLIEHLDRKSYVIVLGLIFLSNIFFQQQQVYSADIAERENYQAATEYLEERVTSQDIVVASAPFTVYPIEYYYHGQAGIVTIPEWSRYTSGPIPAFSEDALHQQIESYRNVYRHMFVLLSYDQGYEDAVINYLDTHLELVETAQFSPGLQSRTYKLRYD